MAESIVTQIALPRRTLVLARSEISDLVNATILPPPIEVVRPGDLVHLRFSFVNLHLKSRDAQQPPVLERSNAKKPAFLIVEMPSQHITEQAFLETEKIKITSHTPPDPPDPDISKPLEQPPKPPVFSSISGPSRLVFKVRRESITYTIDGLLSILPQLDLSVPPQAAPPTIARVGRFLDLWVSKAIDTDTIFIASQRLVNAHTRRDAAAVAGETSVQSQLGAQLTAIGELRRTAQVLEYRFGTDAAVRAFGATRIGAQTNARRLADQLAEFIAIERLPPTPAAPNDTETALELPWRLVISPNYHAAFAHSPTQVEHNGRVELWHTRLGLREIDGQGKPILDDDGHPQVDELRSDYRTVRAIWARDYDVLKSQFPFSSPPNNASFPNADRSQDEPSQRLALNSRDRMMLVHETANFQIDHWTPPAVQINRLMLSSLGGWLDSRVDVLKLPEKSPLTITQWKHDAAMGRDHDVRVVYAGFLMPFGNKASLVKETQRKIVDGPGGPTAYLFQHMYIIVREEEKHFRDNTNTIPSPPCRLDYVMPFSTVRLLTRATPYLDEPINFGSSGELFVPRVGHADFPFKILTIDLEGNMAEFSGPLVFMERDYNIPGADLDNALNIYNSNNAVDREFELHGQRVAFAESKSCDDTILATSSVTFRAVACPNPTGVSQDEPRFLPIIDQAKVVVPAMSALAGAATPISVNYADHYALNGFTDNAAEVFLKTLGTSKLSFAGQGDRSGGLVTPSLDVTGLSRLTGPIGGDVGKAVTGANFDITTFFNDVDAKLFGLIPLPELLSIAGFSPDKVPAFVAQTLNVATVFKNNLDRLQTAATQQAALGAAADNLKNSIVALLNDLAKLTLDPLNAPDPSFAGIAAQLDAFNNAVQAAPLPQPQKQQIAAVVGQVKDQINDAASTIDTLRKFAQAVKVPDVITARLDWSTDLNAWPKNVGIFQPTDDNGDKPAVGKLTLAVEVQAPTKAGQKPTALVSCSISPFKLQLIAPVTFIEIRFKTMDFSIVPGKKPDVNVVFQPGGIVFAGPLEFVNTLKDIIPSDGFSDPPYLDVDSNGIKAGFDLGIPNLAVGVFALQNISLGAHIKVPFIAESIETAFNFCTRENPFRLSVSLFAGGGFFGITITPKEVQVLEASLEFGAAVSLDFGVASGSVSVMAGIYFRLESSEAALTGYFRARGEVDVLGLISACIELYLSLTYETATKKAVGRATLTIEVDVAFFSFSVEISCEKKFAGANSDPSFVDFMGPLPGSLPGAIRPWDTYCHAFADD
jgi:hypothetical protein